MNGISAPRQTKRLAYNKKTPNASGFANPVIALIKSPVRITSPRLAW
jgi:hypothetical protein